MNCEKKKNQITALREGEFTPSYLPDDDDESLEFEECLLRFFFFLDDSLAVNLL